MAFSLGADDYMVKPFSPRDLVSRVTSAIRRRGELIASGDPAISEQPARPFTIVGSLP
jgi:DNA-binding response OmpR family regulator